MAYIKVSDTPEIWINTKKICDIELSESRLSIGLGSDYTVTVLKDGPKVFKYVLDTLLAEDEAEGLARR